MMQRLHLLFLLVALLGLGSDIVHDLSIAFDVEQQCEMEKDASPEKESKENSEKEKEKEKTQTFVFYGSSIEDYNHNDNFTFEKYGAEHIEGVPSPPPDLV